MYNWRHAGGRGRFVEQNRKDGRKQLVTFLRQAFDVVDTEIQLDERK